MRTEVGSGRELLTVGLGGVASHGCVALSERGRMVGVCEQERVTRVRNAGFNASGLPDEALDALLTWRRLTRRLRSEGMLPRSDSSRSRAPHG